MARLRYVVLVLEGAQGSPSIGRIRALVIVVAGGES